MSLKVIGAGFPRTGTSSLKVALQILGYDECYHMKNLLIDPYKLHHWDDLEASKGTDFDKLFDGFQAIVDIPGYLYYETLMKEYPDAKVILSTRPFDKWYSSINSTLKKAVYPNLSLKFKIIKKAITRPTVFQSKKAVDMVKRTFFESQFENEFGNKEKAKSLFEKHHTQVVETVPKEKLLIYQPGDGWEPLCSFLGVPMPKEGYPHLNKKENFLDMMDHLLSGNMV